MEIERVNAMIRAAVREADRFIELGGMHVSE